MKTTEEYEREIRDLNVVINFLKKELTKKSFCRQVMKRQYRELRQKYDTVKPRVEVQVELKEHRFAYFDITNWSKEEAEELLKKWKEIERRNK